jgi:hypothetical protein
MNFAARRSEFDMRLESLVHEFSDVLAPRRCAICIDQDSCEHAATDGTAEQIGDVMLKDWVIFHRWTRFDGKGGYWDWETPNGLTTMDAVGVFTACADDARDMLRRHRNL